jgi:condensation domain-containing protein
MSKTERTTQQAPLSFAQQRLWFLQQLHGGGTYNNILLLRAMPGLNREAVVAAITRLIERHEMLRTIFWLADTGPVQGVLPHSRQPSIRTVRITEGSCCDDERLRRIAVTCARPEFLLDSEPGVRVTLVESATGEPEAIVLVVHHIIWDAESKSIAIRELNSLMRGSPTPETAIPGSSYLQFARKQRADYRSGKLAESLSYWANQLAGVTERRTTNGGDMAPLDFTGHSIPIHIDGQATSRAQRFAYAERSTLFMVLALAWIVLLHVMDGSSDIVTGIDISDRDDPLTYDTVGLFVNQLALRVNLSGDPTLIELCRLVRQACVAAYEHKDAPFDLVVSALRAERSAVRDPVFQTKIYYVEESAAPPEDGVLTEVEAEPPVARHELSLGLTHRVDGISGYLNYRHNAYRPHYCHAAARAYADIVTAIGTRPDLTLSEVVALAGQTLQSAGNQERG